MLFLQPMWLITEYALQFRWVAEELATCWKPENKKCKNKLKSFKYQIPMKFCFLAWDPRSDKVLVSFWLGSDSPVPRQTINFGPNLGWIRVKLGQTHADQMWTKYIATEILSTIKCVNNYYRIWIRCLKLHNKICWSLDIYYIRLK